MSKHWLGQPELEIGVGASPPRNGPPHHPISNTPPEPAGAPGLPLSAFAFTLPQGEFRVGPFVGGPPIFTRIATRPP